MTDMLLIATIAVFSIVAFLLIRYLAEINAPYYCEELSDDTDGKENFTW